MTFILIDIRPEDGSVWYILEQRNFSVKYRYERLFPFLGHRVPIVHYTYLCGFIQRRVIRALLTHHPPIYYLLTCGATPW
jgi:hypothetical protein